MEGAAGRRIFNVETDYPVENVGSDRPCRDLHDSLVRDNESIVTKNRQADHERKHTQHQAHKK